LLEWISSIFLGLYYLPVDAALRLIATGDVAALESGKKALNEALDRASTITQSAAVKLLPKLAALTQHQSLLVSLLAKFDVSGAVDKFIVDFNEIRYPLLSSPLLYAPAILFADSPHLSSPLYSTAARRRTASRRLRSCCWQ